MGHVFKAVDMDWMIWNLRAKDEDVKVDDEEGTFVKSSSFSCAWQVAALPKVCQIDNAH